jgi:hypothetical protein
MDQWACMISWNPGRTGTVGEIGGEAEQVEKVGQMSSSNGEVEGSWKWRDLKLSEFAEERS